MPTDIPISPQAVIDTRVAQISAALHACAVEGIDPAQVSICTDRVDTIHIQTHIRATAAQAVSLLGRLSDEPPRPNDVTPYASRPFVTWTAGPFVVYSHPCAASEQAAGVLLAVSA